jgi:DNA (cytosine-5)-methyltransferase 1
MDDRLTAISLFTGYGGLDMAVEALTGARTVAYVENNPEASRVLAHHYPDVPNLGDVTRINWDDWTHVDIVTAGFPCQGISDAGKRMGLDDERSGLWTYTALAIGVIRPRYAFLENVAALRSRGGTQVTEDLATIGYDLRWVAVRASDAVGACHPRDRFFGIATPHADRA